MNERVYTIVYMIVISVLATALLTGAKLTFAQRIRRNETLREKRTILEGLNLLPAEATAEDVETLYQARVRETEHEGMPLYFSMSADGETIEDVAFEFSGQGFWGLIVGILAMEPDLKTISGYAVLQQQETPGLGARMSAPAFRKQFEGKVISTEGEHYLDFVPENVEPGPSEVHGITGATRTTESLERIVNDGLKKFEEVVGEAKIEDLVPKEGRMQSAERRSQK